MTRVPPPMLVVADFLYPNYAGGSARLVHSFLRGLEQNGIAFRVVTRPPAGVYGSSGESDPAYGRWKTEGRVLEAGPFSIRLFRALRWCSPHTVLNIHHPVLGLFFSWFAPRRRLAYFFHGPWHEEYRAAGGSGLAYRIKRCIQVHVLRRADEVFVLSEHFRAVAAELIGSCGTKVTVIPPMLETRGLAGERDARRKDLRRQWDIPEHATVLFTSRRLTPRTGVLELTRMFRDAFGSDHTLIVVGKGELQGRLEDEIRGVPNIRYLNYVTDTALRELMLLSDAYVLPTLSLEGFGMVLLEAMDTGLPVVASATSGGGREFLETVDPRLIFAMGDGEGLKRALDAARGEHDEAEWLALAARHDVKPQARRWHAVFSH